MNKKYFSIIITLFLITLISATSIDLDWIYPTTNINVSQNEFFNITVNISCLGGNCGAINATLDPASDESYNFTTCGKTGTAGPSQANCDTNYSGTNLEGLISVTNGIQNWTVPETGTYNITIAGAGGGGGTGDPGDGIIIQDNVILVEGQVLKILVGQKGEYYGGSSGAGGGGTFIVNATNSPILIAGGGTGSCNSATGKDGQNTTSGGGVSPGTNGEGGGTGGGGGGGGGLLTNGAAGSYGPGGGSFILGGTGGLTEGGFGGGGGQTNVGQNIAGGGGGYSGGSGNTESNCVNAGGGGSYNATANFKDLGTNPSSGYIKMTFLGSAKGGTVSMTPGTVPFYTNITNPYNLTLNQDESAIITWFVNATGEINNLHKFFIYANQTSNESLNNITSVLNITIKDTTNPTINITYPLNLSYATSITELNYTYEETNSDSCWYSTDNGNTNTSISTAGTNFTGISSSAGTNTWIVYCNDSSGNENSTSITFASTIPGINLEVIYPTTNINVSEDQFFNVTVNISCSNNDCGEINVTLDPAIDTEYNFTTCGVLSGKTGPSQENCDTSYNETNLDGLVNLTSGIQEWIVPTTGTYSIEGYGARGGNSIDEQPPTYAGGGLGAKIVGTFSLTEGDKLYILVGQRGKNSTTASRGGGGGGGTFVTTGSNYSNATPLLIAGGGGGTGEYTIVADVHGQNGTDGGDGMQTTVASSGGAGGTNGSAGTRINYGGSGAGWKSNGQTCYSSATIPKNFTSGGAGGALYSGGADGGFGGGGGCYAGSGGGGGYSGGGGGEWSNGAAGGGGGSYNNGTDQNNTAGVNAKEGYVVVTYIGGAKSGTVSTDPTANPFYTNITNPYNLTLDQDKSAIITWWVNATGTISTDYEFFIYANKTADETISAITSVWNVTIKDLTSPTINITYPLNTTYPAAITNLNYSYSDSNPGSCWYSTDNGNTNTSISAAGTNFTGLNGIGGTHIWIVYCNDSSGNENSSTLTFTSTIPVINITLLSPTTDINVTQNQFFQVQARVTCSNNDCGELNFTLDPISGTGTNYTAYNSSENLGDEYEWEDISEDGTLVSFSNNDDGSSTKSIGFTFPFYDVNYTTSYLSSNGRIHFTSASVANTRLSIPSSSYKLIAPVNNDMYVRSLSKVYIKNTTNPTRMIIQYNNLSFYSYSTTYLSYQVILHEDGKIVLQYHPDNMNYYASYNIGLNHDSSNHLMLGIDAPDQYKGMAITFLPPGYSSTSAKGGTVSTTPGTTPFYTNQTNPYNMTLNEDESTTISWWVNATGSLNSTHTFFVYANKTADETINDISSVWNITILSNGSYISGIDQSAPSITFTTITDNYYTNKTELDINYTASDPNLDACWYSNDTMSLNISLGTNDSCTNITSITWTEGQHNLTIWANDTGGYTKASTKTFTIDTINPNASLLSPENNTYNLTSSQNFTVNITDLLGMQNATLFLYNASNNLVNQTTSTFQENVLKYTLGIVVVVADGVYDWFYKIFDRAGNVFTTSNRTVTVDGTEPILNIIFPLNNTNTSNTELDINYTVYDFNLSSCWYSNDSYSTNTSINCGTNITSITWTEGQHNLTIWANDIGEYENNYQVTFTIDTVNPTIEIINPTNNTNSSNNQLNINYSASDLNLDSCWYSNDSYSTNTSISCGTNITSITWTEGQHNLTVWTNDSAGNINYTSVRFIIDSKNPSIAFEYPINNTYTNNTNLNINYTISDLNLDSCWYSNDSYSTNTSINCGTNITSITWTEGQHNLTIWANDSYGNKNSSLIRFTIDTVHPTLSIIYPTNNTQYSNNQLNINYSASDLNLDSCWYSNDSYSKNTTLANCNNLTTVTWTEGQHNVTIWANDSANHINKSLIVFSIETNPPILEFINPTLPNATLTVNTSVEINVSITETNLKEIIYNWNGTNFTIYNNSLILMMNFDNLSTLGENDTHVLDVSENGNNGAVVGATWNSEGKYGGDFSFDGINDEITIPTTFEIQNKGFSISGWVNLDSTSESGAFIKIGGTSPNVGFAIGVGESSFDNNGNDLIFLYEGIRWIDTNVNIGTGWHHVALSINDNGYPVGFIDGRLIYQDSSGSGTAPQSSITYIGGYTGSTGENRHSDVNLDEVRIWNRTLTNKEIYQHYISNLNKFNSTQWYLYINQSQNATNELDDGNYTYFISAKDNVNNENITETRTITIDSVDITAPVLNITSPFNNSYSSNNQLSINYTATDQNLDSCWYSNDSMVSNITLGDNASCINLTTITWTEGQHNITIWANDTGGYEGNYSITFIIDNTNPTANLLFPKNNTYNSTSSQNFTVNITDSLGIKNATLFIYNSSNNLINQTTTQFNENVLEYALGILVALTDDTYNWFYKIFDRAENNFITPNNTITIDTINPSINIISPNNNTNSSNNQLNINYSISESNIGSCWYSNDTYSKNSTLANCKNLTTITWTEGQHNITIWMNDSVGATNNSQITFSIDSITPQINYGVNTESDYSNISRNNIYVNLSVTELNEKNITFNLYYSNHTLVNSTTFTDQTRSINWTGLIDSNYKFNATIQDYSGNSNSTVTRTIAIDTVNPIISISSPTSITYTSSIINFNLSSNKKLNFCLVSLNNWITNHTMIFNSSFTGAGHIETSLNDDTYIAKFWCNDTFGNINQTENLTFEIDTVNPVVNINHPTTNQYLNYNTSIQLNYTISTNDTDSCWYSIDGQANQTIANCINLSFNLSEGNHQINVGLNDSANLKGNDNINFTIDLTNPYINLISPVNNTLNLTSNQINFYYNVSDSNSISNCSLIINNQINKTLKNPAKDQTNNITIPILNGNYNWSINCTDIANNLNQSKNRNLTIDYKITIDKNKFNGNTTEFSNLSRGINVSSIASIENLTLEKINLGKIRFLETVDLSQDIENLIINFSKHINISQNKIEVNSTALTGLNKKAKLNLHNLTFTDPQILKNQAVCTDCTKESYENGTLTFNVTGFSTYSARETPATPPSSGSSSGGGGGSGMTIEKNKTKVIKCNTIFDCDEGYSCYNKKCVKLFDVEILKIGSLIESLHFELDYLVKGMADINSDVIIKFWIEKNNKKIELGQDTIYLGSFEEKRKTTQLNLPYEIADGDYDLYVESGYENYQAQSFRKINIKIPKETRIKEQELFSGNPTFIVESHKLWYIILVLAMFIILLLVKRTRLIIFKELETVKNNIKYPRIDVTFDEDHEDNNKFYQKQEFEEPIEDQIIKKKREAEIKKVIENKHNPYMNSVGKVNNELPSKIATISSLSRKEVYSESGNFMGIVKRAVLSKKRVIGWIIKPSKRYNLTKDLFVKHKYIKEIESIFLIDKRIENHILHKEKILDFTKTDKFLNYFKKINASKKLKKFSIKKDKTKEW
jgi:hypothetical protein